MRFGLMPAVGQTNIAPGLALPFIGDSGVDANGNPLPGDQGVDLKQGQFDYYAVVVPSNNAALLRTELQAISGRRSAINGTVRAARFTRWMRRPAAFMGVSGDWAGAHAWLRCAMAPDMCDVRRSIRLVLCARRGAGKLLWKKKMDPHDATRLTGAAVAHRRHRLRPRGQLGRKPRLRCRLPLLHDARQRGRASRA